MADFNKLKDTIRGAIYPNGRGAISADKHQAALLDMADTMQETDTKLTELSKDLAKSIEQIGGGSLWNMYIPTGYKLENEQWIKASVNGFYSIIGYLNKGAIVRVNNGYDNDLYAGFYRCDANGNLLEPLGRLRDKEQEYKVIESGFYGVYVQDGMYTLDIHNVSPTDFVEEKVESLEDAVNSNNETITEIGNELDYIKNDVLVETTGTIGGLDASCSGAATLYCGITRKPLGFDYTITSIKTELNTFDYAIAKVDENDNLLGVRYSTMDLSNSDLEHSVEIEIKRDEILFVRGIPYNLQSSEVILYSALTDIGTAISKMALKVSFAYTYTKGSYLSRIEDVEEKVKLNSEEVNQIKKDVAEFGDRIPKFSFIPIYQTRDFGDWQTMDNDNRGGWDLTNSGIKPSAIGGYVNDYICGGIYLNNLYQSNQVVFLIEAELKNDTILNIHFLRGIQTGTLPNDTTFIIDGSKGQIELLKNINRKVVSEPYKTTNIPFVLNGSYLIECKRIEYTYSLKITNKLTGESCEIENKGNWDAGSMMSKLAFTWGGGASPIIHSVKIYEPSKLNAIIVGDSITEGLGLYYDSYSYILSKELGASCVSAAASAVIQDVLSSFDSEFELLKPQYLIVTIGTNNYAEPISNLKPKLQEIVEKCKAQGIIPIINHIPCNTIDMQFVRNFNEMIDSLNVETVMFDIATSINNNPLNGCDTSLFQDGVHPNKEGAQKMLQRVKIDLPFLFVA